MSGAARFSARAGLVSIIEHHNPNVETAPFSRTAVRLNEVSSRPLGIRIAPQKAKTTAEIQARIQPKVRK